MGGICNDRPCSCQDRSDSSQRTESESEKLAKSYSTSFWRRKKYVRKKLSSRSCVNFTTSRMKKSYWPLSAAKPLLWEKRTRTSWEKSKPATGRNTWRSPSGTATRKTGRERTAGKEKINPKEILKLTEESLQKKYIMAECCHPIPGDDVWVTLMKTTALLFINASALLLPSWKAAMVTVY